MNKVAIKPFWPLPNEGFIHLNAELKDKHGTHTGLPPGAIACASESYNSFIFDITVSKISAWKTPQHLKNSRGAAFYSPGRSPVEKHCTSGPGGRKSLC
jgi:hypothetical protein